MRSDGLYHNILKYDPYSPAPGRSVTVPEYQIDGRDQAAIIGHEHINITDNIEQ